MIWIIIQSVYIAITATLALYSYYFKNKYFIWTKPLPVLGPIIFQIINMLFFNYAFSSIFIVIALIFGMLGDILLVNKKYFLFGMASFLICHILYIIRFKSYKWNLPIYFFIAIFVISIIFGIFVTIKMSSDKRKQFVVPVWGYIIIISLMFLAAINFEFAIKRSIPYYIIGAAFFYVSDAILSIDNFVKPFKLSMLMVLITYYIAQLFISLGTVL